jgi:hypothetical protein
MSFFKVTMLVILAVVTISCSTGKCRQVNSPDIPKTLTAEEEEKQKLEPQEISKTVKVFKYDGSKQCGMGKAIDLAIMERELKGIKVVASEKKNDGMMRIQMCGAASGDANLYEIDRKDLKKAEKKGFKVWKDKE